LDNSSDDVTALALVLELKLAGITGVDMDVVVVVVVVVVDDDVDCIAATLNAAASSFPDPCPLNTRCANLALATLATASKADKRDEKEVNVILFLCIISSSNGCLIGPEKPFSVLPS
jgi:hypothetical protein